MAQVSFVFGCEGSGKGDNMRKKNIWKKMASVLLAAAMILTAVPVGASGFTAEEVEDFQVEEMELLQEENEEENPVNEGVASVGEQEYASIESAISNAGTDAVIKILKDVAENINIDSGKNISLDLNGKTISGIVKVYGALTILDNTVTSAPLVSDDYCNVTYNAGKIINQKGAVYVENGGSLILNSGIVESREDVGIRVSANDAPNSGDVTLGYASLTVNGGYITAQEYGIGVYGRGAVLNINDGVVVSKDNAAVAGNGTNNSSSYYGGTTINISGGTMIGHITSEGYIACGIYHPQKGELNITGGTIYADGGVGVLMRGGVLTMKGGEVISTGSVQGKIGDSQIVQNCYGIQIDGSSNYYDYAESKIMISGGTVTSASSVPALNATDTDKGKLIVSGGTFSNEVPKEYCAEGFVQKNNGDGTFGVRENYVASVGEQKFETLQAAINSVVTGTIKLEYDTVEDITIPEGASIVLDLNGKTLRNNTNHTITNKGNLVIQDTSEGQTGTIDNITHAKGALVNEATGTVTIKSGQLTRSREAGDAPNNNGGNSWYVIRNNGIVNIEGGSVISSSGFSSTICSSEGTLNISGGSISGRLIAVKNETNSQLNISGGTISNDVNQAVQNWGNANITSGTLNGSVISWSFTDNENNNDYSSKTTISGNVEINGKVAAVNYRQTNAKTEVIITGGTIKGSVEKAKYMDKYEVVDSSDESSTIVISGGTFSKEVPEEFCAPGFEPVKNADGSYGVEKPAPVIPVYYYNVTFDSQGGSSVSPIYSVREYTTIKAPVAPTKEGYDFAGWYKDAEGTTPWDFEKDWVTRNITLYAKWTEKEPEIPPVTAPAPVVVKLEEKTTNEVSISWTASEGALGYTLWTRAEGEDTYTRRYICYGDEGRSYTWKNRKPGTKYYFVVKAWTKDENGAYLFSEASRTVRGTTKPLPAEIEKVTVNANGDMKVTLRGKAVGANRYAMCWSRTADFGRYRIGIRTQYTKRTIDKNLKPGTYYVKVRSYRQLSTSRVYGDWSEAVKVVIS